MNPKQNDTISQIAHTVGKMNIPLKILPAYQPKSKLQSQISEDADIPQSKMEVGKNNSYFLRFHRNFPYPDTSPPDPPLRTNTRPLACLPMPVQKIHPKVPFLLFPPSLSLACTPLSLAETCPMAVYPGLLVNALPIPATTFKIAPGPKFVVCRC